MSVSKCENSRSILEAKQARRGNHFQENFNQFDKQLRGEGVPVEEIGQQLLAPGVTREIYVQTLRAFERLETISDRVRYKRRKRGC
jgi:hypothetical protein